MGRTTTGVASLVEIINRGSEHEKEININDATNILLM
jgi:hypothetical protein